MLPSQRRAVLAWVTQGLADAGVPIPADRVVPAPQDAAELARPYALLTVTGSTVLGPRPEQTIEGETLRSNRPGTASISITIVGAVDVKSYDDEPASYIGPLEGALWLPDAQAGLDAAGLAVNAVTPIADAGARLKGDAQWEPRAALDVTFNLSIDTTAAVEPVSEVEITGTTDPPVPIGTITVEAPPP